jgi:SAM-dependent methyltransferase
MSAIDYEKLARFYDGLVDVDEDIEFFVHLSKCTEGRVLELMAGTGRVSVPIAEAGVQLTCVDNSAEMLSILENKLKRKNLNATIVIQDVGALHLESSFPLAFIAFNSFEEITENISRQAALKKVHSHLDPHGRFVCTLHDPSLRLRSVGPDHEMRRLFKEPGTGRNMVMHLKTSYDKKSGAVHGIERFEDWSTGEVLLELPISFCLIEADEFKELAEGSGFTVEALYGNYEYGPYVPGESHSMVWFLRRGESV